MTELLCLCAPADQRGLDELCQHLKTAGLPFRVVAPGLDEAVALETAAVVVPLLSVDFFTEKSALVEVMLARWRVGTLRIVPVLWRAVDYAACPLAELAPLPGADKAVAQWKSRHAGWVAVVQALRGARRRQQRWALLGLVGLGVVVLGAALVAVGLHERRVAPGVADLERAPESLLQEQPLEGTIRDKQNHAIVSARVRVLEAQAETWTDRDGVFRLMVRGAKDDPVTLRVDQGADFVEDHTVTLGQTRLGLAVRRRP